jgi:hypothetical protein
MNSGATLHYSLAEQWRETREEEEEETDLAALVAVTMLS